MQTRQFKGVPEIKWSVAYWSAGVLGVTVALYGCSGDPTDAMTPQATAATQQHILFVGDSFTHGRYQPVRQYNSGGTQTPPAGSALVVDENFGQTGARAETLETGPFGGIPGIFAELALESKLNYDVHIEAISQTDLQNNYAAASSVIDQSKWNAVVLQELSVRPLPYALTGNSVSDPSAFCGIVQTIEQGVHKAAPSANIYLYETWPRSDMALSLSGSPTSQGFSAAYSGALTELADAYHNVYYRAAALDGSIAAVAPVGEAWTQAWAEDIANPDPYSGTASGPSLWYGINAVNNPSITEPDYLHPSIYGAYLSGLVLFQQITGLDVRTFGAAEIAASQMGIDGPIASQLQQVAWETVTQENPAPINQTVDPCSVTH